MSAEAWDERLRPLVVKHGANLVWSVGCKLFGHPPTWEINTKQYGALCDSLSQLLKGNQ